MELKLQIYNCYCFRQHPTGYLYLYSQKMLVHKTYQRRGRSDHKVILKKLVLYTVLKQWPKTSANTKECSISATIQQYIQVNIFATPLGHTPSSMTKHTSHQLSTYGLRGSYVVKEGSHVTIRLIQKFSKNVHKPTERQTDRHTDIYYHPGCG